MPTSTNIGERQIPPAEIRNQPLEERKDQPRVVERPAARSTQQHDADDERDQKLRSPSCSAATGRDGRGARSSGSRRESRWRRTPPSSAPRSRRRRSSDRPRAASGTSAAVRISRPPIVGVPAFGAMAGRPLLPDHLADLELAQLADHPRPEHQADRQRRQARRRRAERDVARHVQHARTRVRNEVRAGEYSIGRYTTPELLRRRLERFARHRDVVERQHAGCRSPDTSRGPCRRSARDRPARASSIALAIASRRSTIVSSRCALSRRVSAVMPALDLLDDPLRILAARVVRRDRRSGRSSVRRPRPSAAAWCGRDRRRSRTP